MVPSKVLFVFNFAYWSYCLRQDSLDRSSYVQNLSDLLLAQFHIFLKILIQKFFRLFSKFHLNINFGHLVNLGPEFINVILVKQGSPDFP